MSDHIWDHQAVCRKGAHGQHGVFAAGVSADVWSESFDRVYGRDGSDIGTDDPSALGTADATKKRGKSRCACKDKQWNAVAGSITNFIESKNGYNHCNVRCCDRFSSIYHITMSKYINEK